MHSVAREAQVEMAVPAGRAPTLLVEQAALVAQVVLAATRVRSPLPANWNFALKGVSEPSAEREAQAVPVVKVAAMTIRSLEVEAATVGQAGEPGCPAL